MKTAKKCFALALAFVLTLSAASALPARTARADAGGPVQVWYYDMPGWDAASQTLGDWYCLADDWAGHDNPGDPDNYWGPMPLHGAPGDGQFSYTFNGTGFEYYSSGGWINDSMDLLIDGELAWRFNWGDNRDGCIYSNMDLAPGEHTVTLKGNGNFLYFMIYGGGEDSGGAAVTGVSLDKTSASVAVGKTTQLTATVEPSDAADKAVSWKSSNEDIATVSQTGLVTAEAEGEADITATTDDGGFSAVCAVTVTPAASGGSLPTGNLLAWWDMDNLTGNTEYDKIGDAYDAVTDGADTEGVCNGALAFNGSSTMIDVARTLDGDTSVLDSAGVSVWINPASLPPAVYGNKYDNESILSSTEVNPDPEQYWLCAQGAFALELTPAGAIVARLWDNGGGAPIITAGSGFGSGVYDYGTFTTDDDVIKPNEWQNVAFSYDIGTQEATIYVNGTALVTATYSTAIQPDFNGLEIGMRSGPYAQGANYFNGSMDELMIYGRALSASDIAQIIAYDGSGYVAVPGATGLTVSGNAAVGETLTGSFRPTNGATTADSAYQWYSADTAAGEKTAIIGAESDTYTLTGGDAGKYIFFAVTPSDGETTGAAVYSSAFGPVKAAPSGLTLPDGAIAHWLLDDITDGGVLDEVSGVRDAITNGAAVAGVKDGGVGFAGDTQIAAAQVATTAGGDTLGAMTVSMWIKPTATNVQQLLFGAGDLNIQSNNGSFMIFLADGQIAAGISDGSWNGCTSDMLSDGRWSQILSSGANSVKASVWQNITVTYDNGAGAAPGVVQIYIDGKLKNSGTYAQENYPRPADVANIVIGAGAVTDGWGVANAAAGYGGAMDEALIYGRVLDASEVAQVYDYAKDGAAAAPTGLPADALAHWDMNDTQGGTLAYDSVNDVDNAIANGAAGEGVKDGGVDFTGGAAVADSTQIAAAQVGAAAGGDLGALSVSLWINPSTTSGQQLLFGTSGMNMQAGDGSFVILLADGQIAAGISDSSWNGCTSDMIPGGYWGYGWYPDGGTPHGMLLASGANSVKPGVWQNVTVTYDQGTGVEQIYMDGVLLNSGTYTYNPSLVSVANVVIGAGVVTDQAWVATSVGGYSGAMDEVMIYGRVLNPLEAGQIYDYAKDGVGPAAPSAWGVSVTYAGTAAIGTELTGVYTYNSADGEAEGASAYQWYRSLSSGSSGKSAIPGATGKTYTLTGDDSGNYVFFGVTPVSESGAKGIEAVSAGVYLRVSDGGNYIPLKPNMMTETAVGTYSPVLYAKDGFQWNGDFDSNYTQYTGVHIPVAGSNNPVSGISGDSDCSGDAYFAYDDNNFYMGVKVLDDTHTPGPVGRNWDGDGLQFAFADCAFASFRSEFGVALQSDGTFDIERDSDGMAVLTKDAIGMNFWRDEATHCTYYELCIPWMAVMSGPPPEGSTQRFTVAINDKDGDSGRGYVAWTDGIVSTKSIQDLANIELIPKETDPWSAWISGPAQVNAGTSGQYTLYVPNYSSETFAADVDLPEYTGTYQTHIEVPPGYAYKQVFTVYVPSDMDIHANITPVSGKAKTALLHVTAVLGAGDISDMFTDLETNILPALQELIGNVNAAGLTTQYEDIDATILGQYIVLGREDLANNRADRAQYIALTLYQLAAGATADLNAYLNGTKTPLESPTYVTPADAAGGAKPSSESYSMMGPTTDGERPIYFTGYGMFDRVIHDVPLFPQLGTNIVDVNFGPSGVIMQPGAMTSWGTWYDTGSSVYPPVFALDDTTSTDGNYSV
ncbi:MAG: Ig-like domain-containing protein, partial [Defluviitaleaceae bacterium]|nr:Ig-like domain-containing protein [Defluviitaleaceae bacterium]